MSFLILLEIGLKGAWVSIECDIMWTKLLNSSLKFSLDRVPANNAMQGQCGPCKGCPYGTRIDLAAGAAVAPHGFNTQVSCGSNY